MDWVEQAINIQRDNIKNTLHKSLHMLAINCARKWPSRTLLDHELKRFIQGSSQHRCRLLYVIDKYGVQRSSNISEIQIDSSIIGRDLSERPYHREITQAEDKFLILSKVYIDKNTHKPCITALNGIFYKERFMGYVAADFCLNNLPLQDIDVVPRHPWRQIKGDPSIRSTLFQQTRTISAMDQKLDEVMDVVESLMTEQGIFHVKLHFSSSRATLWSYHDPYRYRLHVLEEIIDPEVCLVYAKTPYPEEACVSSTTIAQIFNIFKILRQADETIYLRAASLNIINGVVGLNFSCDGTHYMQADEFLDKDLSFWLGDVDSGLCNVCEGMELEL